jgi:hypothetical protein
MAGMEFATVEANEVALSVRIFRPAWDVPKRDMTVVMAHQYSVLGGNQALLKGLATALSARGFTALTFDMRGAGRSTGRPTLTGYAEVQDVAAVCKWAVEHVDARSILLVGNSAGAPIAGSAIDEVPEVVGYVALGYPFGMLASVLFGRHNKPVLASLKPKLFVMGTSDGFTSVKQLEAKLKSAAGRNDQRLVPGAGHFEMEGPQFDRQMADYIVEFADSLHPPPNPPSQAAS